MSVKCEIEGCNWNGIRWDSSNSYRCAFHNPWIAGGSMVEVVDYFRTATNEAEGKTNISAPLHVKGVEIPKNINIRNLESLKRALQFTECSFQSGWWMHGGKFGGEITFEGCNFKDQEDASSLKFFNCEFMAGVSLQKSDVKLEFVDCRFKGNCTFNVRSGREKEDRCVVFNSCKFLPGELNRYSIQMSAGTLHFLKCEIGAELNIGRNADIVIIDETAIRSHTAIDTSKSSYVRIIESDVYKDFTLYCHDRPCGIQSELCIAAVNLHDGAHIILRGISLSQFTTPDFVFHDVILQGIDFPTRANRLILPQEISHLEAPHVHDDYLGEPSQRIRYLRESYKNLKLYYDSTGDYHLANNFHACELWAQWQQQILQKTGMASLLHRSLSWHALYYGMSDFGQSWLRPLVWILVFTLLAWVGYTVIGVYPEGHASQYFTSFSDRLWYGLGFTFRRLGVWFRSEGLTPLIPFHWLGWMIAFFQVSVTLVAGAFFLLALRRRFKR